MRFSSEVTEALLAQWLERAAVNRKVTGSIPVGSVFDSQRKRDDFAFTLTLRSGWHRVRVVKESDLNSDGLCPRRFEPGRCRFLGIATSARWASNIFLICDCEHCI